MESAELRQKLHHFIENAEEKKLQAIFTMVEDEISQYYEHWNDDEFINELHEREQTYLNATAKIYTATESATRAKNAIDQQSK